MPSGTNPESETEPPTSAGWVPVAARVSRRLGGGGRARVADAPPGLSSVENRVLPPLYGSVLPVNAIVRESVTAGFRGASFCRSVVPKLAEPRRVVVSSVNETRYHRRSTLATV